MDFGRHTTLFAFTFERQKPDLTRIFDSAFLPPARYLEILYSFLFQTSGQTAEAIFIFNPYYEFRPIQIKRVIDSLQKLSPHCITVLADRNRPIGYFFPRLPDISSSKPHMLWLLSAVDAALDCEILKTIFGLECDCIQQKLLPPGEQATNGFEAGGAAIWLWLATRNVAIAKKSAIASIPFAAYMPHHAGDVLFLSLASKYVDTAVTDLVVSASYGEIVRKTTDRFNLHLLSGDAFSRGQNTKEISSSRNEKAKKKQSEFEYLEQIKDELPNNAFLIFMRLSRDYNTSILHLIDHYAVALSGKCLSSQQLVSRKIIDAAHFEDRPVRNAILIHFDAGWPLKIYPEEHQQELVDRIVAMGYSVSVLGGAASGRLRNCTIHKFEDLQRINDLLNGHDLIIGMDSFPVHWSAYIQNIPSLVLFGSTRPENSYISGNPLYKSTENGMTCCPCYRDAVCPIFQKKSCRNFSSPSHVVAMITDILQHRKGKQASSYEADNEVASFDEMASFDGLPPKFPSKFIRLQLVIHNFKNPIIRTLAHYRVKYARSMQKRLSRLKAVFQAS